jgi:YVTN family beta-propeller protein
MKIKFLAALTIGPFGTMSSLSAQAPSNLKGLPAIVYVSNGGSGITEVNTANNSVIATAAFPNNANGVVITPDGRRMYVTNRDVGQVTVFDTATNVPLMVIPVGNGNDNLGLAISPDGELVYVANQFSGTVTVIYTLTNAVIQTISTGAGPSGSRSRPGLRAVNSRGEIGGFQIATPGGPPQAYIATPVAAAPADE